MSEQERQPQKTPEPPRHCPVCGEVVAEDSKSWPFCGPRCKLADLGRWFKGSYVISRPVEQQDLDEGP